MPLGIKVTATMAIAWIIHCKFIILIHCTSGIFKPRFIYLRIPATLIGINGLEIREWTNLLVQAVDHSGITHSAVPMHTNVAEYLEHYVSSCFVITGSKTADWDGVWVVGGRLDRFLWVTAPASQSCLWAPLLFSSPVADGGGRAVCQRGECASGWMDDVGRLAPACLGLAR